MKHKTYVDKLGIFISAACVVHCLVIAFLPSIVPAFLMTHGAHNHDIHIFVVIAFLVIAPISFLPGYKKHGNSRIIKIAAVGFALTLLGLVFEITHVLHGEAHYLSVFGSVLIVIAHIKNVYHSHSKKHECC